MSGIEDQFLFDKHITETQRMPAVLLGVASAAIGFAFHETKDQTLNWPLCLQLAAILLWSGSFTGGVLFSRFTAIAIRQNIAMNMAERFQRKDFSTRAKSSFDKANKRAGRSFHWQQTLLVGGAVLYLIGHIWSIQQNTQTAMQRRAQFSLAYSDRSVAYLAFPVTASPLPQSSRS